MNRRKYALWGVILMLVSCALNLSVLSIPVLSAESMIDTLLPQAQVLCNKAFTSDSVVEKKDSIVGPILALKNIKYKGMQWGHHKIPLIEAKSVSEVRTLL
jgi:hypothetical protein